MKKRFFLVAVCFAFLPALVSAQNQPGIRDSVFSEILKETRQIQVVLPEAYKDNPDQKFEVLYVLDGEWYMEQIPFIFRFVVSSGYAPPHIFVLLPNTYKNQRNLRDRDFSPTRIGNDSLLGGADNFHAFLKTEVIPYIEKKYRTSGQRSLVGSSFSGLFSVYAFLKDPGLFQSFVASDPNLNWDNHYVTRLAAERLPTFEGISSTLFIAGLTRTFKDMGIAGMDSVLRATAPKSIPWKCLPYENESHYSVQHKAFYDGFRFSHQGYTKSGIEFHPMNGIVEAGKPLAMMFLTQGTPLRYSLDGGEPSPESPLIPDRGPFILNGPAHLKIKSVSNRAEYARDAEGKFDLGEPIRPPRLPKASKPGLEYRIYEGQWDNFPALTKLKASRSGKVDEKLNINDPSNPQDAAWVINGFIDIPEDGYYVFYSHSGNQVKATIADIVLFDTDGSTGKVRSHVLPLKKGLFPLRIEWLHQMETGGMHFMIGGTSATNNRWWEKPFFRL